MPRQLQLDKSNPSSNTWQRMLLVATVCIVPKYVCIVPKHSMHSPKISRRGEGQPAKDGSRAFCRMAVALKHATHLMVPLFDLLRFCLKLDNAFHLYPGSTRMSLTLASKYCTLVPMMERRQASTSLPGTNPMNEAVTCASHGVTHMCPAHVLMA